MARLCLSKKVKMHKLSKGEIKDLKNFLKQNWDKYIPEKLVEKWNQTHTPKIDKKKVVYHLTKLNIKVPYNEVYKIKHKNKTQFIKEDIMDLKNRREKIKTYLPIKYFYEEDFDSNSKRNQILLDIKIEEINGGDNIFKCGPLLKKDQEYHLFRKYNYLKYRLFKLTNVNIDRLKIGSIEQVESMINKVEELRNTLLKCNTRLILRPVSRHYTRDSIDREEFISNGYTYLLKAIDCFDYRRGFKFSTYSTWVLKNNLSRDKGKILKNKTVFIEDFNNDEENNYETEDKKEGNYANVNYEYNKSFINSILKDLELSRNSTKEIKTKIRVIEKLYGLNGEKPALLREVGELLGLSKERIRQIKNETIKILQKSNYVYDPVV